MTDLEVHGVSDDGMDAVGTFWDVTGNHAFVTAGSSIVNIGPTSGSTTAQSSAWDISADGTIVVGEVNPGMPGTQTQAVVWKNDGTYVFRPVFDLLRERRSQSDGLGLASRLRRVRRRQDRRR